MVPFRIGHGYDVHRLVSGRKLVLGGVEIPHELGLLGHSDADVLLHAVCDAILGAIGCGDIGHHFPDSAAEFKDISSLKLLARVIITASNSGWVVGNIDATVIAQRPKLAPHLIQMVDNIGKCCQVCSDKINIKATTTEKLGFEGRQEGISAHAVVIMVSNNDHKRKVIAQL
ncbi:MAG: 2-C-methyl-D-erythritol 2,4-cyclodiphosphate synthase [Desulfobacteraceae bacterium 4572_35.1]|nr:MAG: 2-C-methyl-D-erythritol 2,4-cyclodiphosphate synthase [Desulfobacteraceae bacterium 4572_35.1]